MNDRRFFFYVEKTPSCWVWTGSKGRDGYGYVNRKFGNSYKTRTAHRWAWELAYGSIPNGLWVLHKCDNPSCVNPEHLFLGTAQDNVDDMIRKGRARHDKSAFGENHPQAKLTENDVRVIRSSPLSLSKMAKQFGVCMQTISHVRNNKVWRHVK